MSIFRSAGCVLLHVVFSTRCCACGPKDPVCSLGHCVWVCIRRSDLNIIRFILLVLIFVVSIIFLIISPNIISILLGWDGLGLVFYLLVIYCQNVKSYGAGMLTVLSNHIGDVALLMVIAWIINFGSWSFIYYLDFISGSIEIELILV